MPTTTDDTTPLLLPSPDVQDSKPNDRLLYYLALGGLVTIAGATWAIILTNHPSKLSYFAFHPPFQSLAILLIGLGILTLQPTSKAQPARKKAGLARHQIFNLALALPTILAGSVLIFVNKASHGAKHFTTWHSVFGAVSVLWIVLQVFVGAGSVWFGGVVFGGGDHANRVYKYHRISGYMLFTNLLVTAHLAGSWSDWFVLKTNVYLRVIAYGIAPAAVLGALVMRARMSKLGL